MFPHVAGNAPPQGAIVSNSLQDVGDLVAIECLPGYASSEAAAECLSDGTFTSVVCSAISCPAHSTGTVRPGKPHTW